MNEFHYYYLIKDAAGLLISALGIKLSIIFIFMIAKNGINRKKTMCLLGNLVLIITGIFLVVASWSLKTLIITLALLNLSWLCGRLVYSQKTN